jgi:histidinol-phosphate aminotransferase
VDKTDGLRCGLTRFVNHLNKMALAILIMLQIKKAVAENPLIKLIFLCSPGNPTGTLIPLSSIRSILEFSAFTGFVVVDEAYIDFTPKGTEASAVSLIEKYSNLVVMQTLSKSFGLAGIRLGIAFAQEPLIRVLSNTKAPYNISTPTALLALRALRPSSIETFRKNIAELAITRKLLVTGFAQLPDLGNPIGSGDANFILVPVLDRETKTRPDSQRAQAIYKEMAENRGVVVRYRGNEKGCEGCLRVTVGTRDDVTAVLRTLEALFKQM